MARSAPLALLSLVLSSAPNARPSLGQDAGPAGEATSPERAAVRFVNEAAAVGVVLRNVSGTPAKRSIVESTGAGACFLDYDLDGDLDLFLVNGATLETAGPDNPASDALYENDGRNGFLDVTESAGVGDRGWGGGCAVADYDNDGDPDLYLTHYGADALYRNEDGGTFREVATQVGVTDPRWSLGAVFFDADRDGDLDLYVANYLEFDAEEPGTLTRRCHWKGGEVMCGPRGFTGQADVYYRNNGDGTFDDASADAGLGGDALYGMGAVAGDLDGDGHTDLFVASDSQENLLWVNDGTGRFRDQALAAGLAFSGDGREQAGMGADLGDYDGDGDEDLFVTNFSDDYHTLYRNDGDLLFTDVSGAAGLDPVTRPSLGWAGNFLDYDNDGDLDLFVAGGHVYPEVDTVDPATSYRQRNLLLENDGSGRFREVGDSSGAGLAETHVGRGAAFGDYDDDGDLDIVVVNDNEPPSLLRNDGGNGLHWIKLRLRGTRSNRDGIGARLRLAAGELVQFREVRQGGGYLSSHDPRLHFGLGGQTLVERLEIEWPSGTKQIATDLPARHLVTIDEERGVVSVEPLAGWRRDRAAPGEPAPAPAQPAAATHPAQPVGRLTLENLQRVDAWVQQGTRSIQAGRYAAGISAYEQALAVLPAWEAAAASSDALGFGDRERYRGFLASLWDNLGVGLMRAERLEECATAIDKALSIQSDRAKFHYNLGLCHFHGRRYEAAVASLEAAAAAGERSAGLDYDLGRALAAAGRCEAAIVALSAAVAGLPRPDPRGRDAEAWYHLGDCHSEAGGLAAASDAFREVLARVPGHQKALYRLALVRRRANEHDAGQRAEGLFLARQEADEAVRALKRSGAAGRDQRLELVQGYLEARLAPQAVQEAQALVVAEPEDPQALELLGRALLALRPPALAPAREAFSRLLAVAAASPPALAGLGEALRQDGQLAEAAALFARALALDPDQSTATVGLARLAAAAGDWAAALERLEAAATRGGAGPAALLALAELTVAAPEGPLRRPREALAALDHLPRLYGEGEETRLRALALLGEAAAAARLLAESPFLGREERAALDPLVADGPR